MMALADCTKHLIPQARGSGAIKVIGLGGIGGPVARYLGQFAASGAVPGLDRLVLIDGDSFEPGNTVRMFFRKCGNKAAVLREELHEYFADSPLTILAMEAFVTRENIQDLIQEGDIVILAVDNHRTRKLVSDHFGSRLRDACLISAGNDPAGPDSTGRILRGTYGNCQSYIRRHGQNVTPSLTCHHPEIEHPTDIAPNEKSCIESISASPQILFTNLTAATCVLSAFYRYLCWLNDFPEVAFDIADALMRPVSYSAAP